MTHAQRDTYTDTDKYEVAQIHIYTDRHKHGPRETQTWVQRNTGMGTETHTET